MSEIMSLAPLLHSPISYFFLWRIHLEKENWAGGEEEKKLYIRCVKGCRGGWIGAGPAHLLQDWSVRSEWWETSSVDWIDGKGDSLSLSLRFAGLPATITWREGCTSPCIKPGVPPPVDKDRMLKYDGRHLSFFPELFCSGGNVYMYYILKREGGRCVFVWKQRQKREREEQHCDDLHDNARFKNLSFCVYT